MNSTLGRQRDEALKDESGPIPSRKRGAYRGPASPVWFATGRRAAPWRGL